MATRRDGVRRVKREDEYYDEDAYVDDAGAEDDGRGMGRLEHFARAVIAGVKHYLPQLVVVAALVR
jgi:hypothetical protein